MAPAGGRGARALLLEQPLDVLQHLDHQMIRSWIHAAQLAEFFMQFGELIAQERRIHAFRSSR